MHDTDFAHLHVTPEERQHLSETIWAADNVELTTVGIDIGSSTSHLMFARVHVQRLSTALSSRFVVVGREILWRSAILLTPYRPDHAIDAGKLGAFFDQAYRQAGLGRGDIDSGAVILTGEALKRKNARAIAELFAVESGKLVCASAGHHLEAAMGAHGAGAIALSRQKANVILNVDIGGGSTKFALVRNGDLVATAALAVGGRLLVLGEGGVITRLEDPLRRLGDSLALRLEPGARLDSNDRERLVREMADIVMAMTRQEPPAGMARNLLLTEPLPMTPKPDAITFSGGVAEYLFGRETQGYGDLGPALARRIGHALGHGGMAVPVWDPGQGIRATVIGAAQFSVQVSGNTILITDPSRLPLRDIPVLSCRFDLDGDVDRRRVAAEVRRALARHDLDDGGRTVALAFPWRGDPLHARLHALADGLCSALPATRGGPLVVLVDGDIGMTLGRIVRDEIAPGCDVVAIDGVQLKDLDYVDIGEIIRPTNVVPVIIKSLLF
ncbi:MAG: ethanolamine ammonia-lyase reactivating factor EutA [Kiloniellaceae bacterium]